MTTRLLFACWPFPGHVFPQISVALAARERGAEVAFYTGESARGHLEHEGLTLFPFQEVDENRWLRVQHREAGTATRRQSLRVQHQAFRDWLVETIPGQVSDIGEITRSWSPDVIVTDLSMWGPVVVLWESLPIPVALFSFIGPLIPGPDAPPPGFGMGPPRTARARATSRLATKATDLVATGLRRRVDQLRADNALPALECSVNEFTGRLPLYISATIPELDFDRHDLPPSVSYVGPCLWNPPTTTETAAWLDELPTDLPWVHVTEGTSHHQEPFLLRAGAQGLGGLPMQVILTTGGDRDPDALGLGTLAPNVLTRRWVSHTDLLPRCAVVVTTGGPATVMASLRAGVPLVVSPTTWDKPDNARRVVEAGVGVRLAPRRCNPASLRAAVEEVLGDPAYRERAERVARQLAAAPGPEGAAALLESLAATSADINGDRRRAQKTPDDNPGGHS